MKMKAPLAVLVCLAGPAAAQTSFDLSASEAVAAVRAAAAPLRDKPREVACAVESDRAIEAVNQIKMLKPEQRLPVSITQADSKRVEIRARALPVGFQPRDTKPGFVRATGVMIRETGATGYAVVSFLFEEFHGGNRLLDVWQIDSKNSEMPKRFTLDLSRAATADFSAVVASKSGDIPVRVFCSVADAPAPTR